MNTSPQSPVIALDYDGTCTLNIEAWVKAVLAWKEAGFTVYIVTMRAAEEQILFGKTMDPRLTSIVDKVFYTRRKGKREALAELGIKPSVWIDDTPEAIFLDAGEVWPRETPIGEVIDVAQAPGEEVKVDITGIVRQHNHRMHSMSEAIRQQGETTLSVISADGGPLIVHKGG